MAGDCTIANMVSSSKAVVSAVTHVPPALSAPFCAVSAGFLYPG